MAMIKEYSYLYKIISNFINSTEYIADEINMAGSRKAAKTWSIDELISNLSGTILAYPNKKIAIYGFRLNSADTAEMQQDLQDALDRIGLILNPTKKWKGGHYQYNARFNKPTWTFPNGSFIKLQGARKSNSNQVLGKGTARAMGADLCIIWLEEANIVPLKFDINSSILHVLAALRLPAIFISSAIYSVELIKLDIILYK